MTAIANDREYLISRGWNPTAPEFLREHPEAKEGWFDPRWAGAPQDEDCEMVISRALVIQRARDSEEERRAFDRYFAVSSAMVTMAAGEDGTEELRPMFSIEAARDRARRMIEYRREAFGGPMRPAYTIDLPPRPCTGAGTIPPRYCGITAGSSTAFSPAPCGLCGQVVAVDGHMRTVTHPYKAPAGTPAQED